MARLLVEWLNEEVRLSRLVTSLDNDFCDGYLIGELLHKYNQQSNFEEFLNTGAADAKIKNFCLLEPTMRQIGVHYNSRIAQDIMNAKPSVMKTLLYEIRTTLDIITKRSAAVMNHNPRVETEEIDPEKPKKILCVIQPSRPLYDKTMSITFENAVRSMMENPNDVMMAHATRRFQERKRQLRLSASVGLNDELEEMQNDLQRRKQMDRQRRKHEMEFQEAWDLRNREQWQKNQTIAHERRALEQKVIGKARSQEINRVMQNQQATRDNTFKSIDDFETKLKSAIFREDDPAESSGTNTAGMLKTIGGNPGTGIPELTYLDQTVLKNNLVHAQKTIKEHHEHMTHHQALHGRRRRKFVRENESTRTGLLQKQAEEEIVSQVLDPCISEIYERRDHRRVYGHVNMIRDNGENRQVLLTSVLEADASRDQQWREQEADHELHWIVAQRMNSQGVRADMLDQAQAAASRFDALAMMESEIERILDLADWVIASRAFGLLNISPADIKEEEAEAASAAVSGSATPGGTAKTITPGKKGAPHPAASTPPVETVVSVTPLNEALTTGLLPGPLWKVVKAMYCSKFNLSAALPYPEKTYVYGHLPNSLSFQPLCIDTATYVKTPFSGSDLFTAQLDISREKRNVPSLNRAKSFFVNHHYGDSEGLNDPLEQHEINSSKVVSLGNPENVLTDYLAYSDSWEFLDHLLKSDDLGGDTILTTTNADGSTSVVSSRPTTAAGSAPVSARRGKGAEEEEEKPGAKTITKPPAYLFETPPKYLLGELLLDVSCTHVPLPHDPVPEVTIDVTAMPLKLALSGPSGLGKSMVAAMLKERLGVKVFNCEELIHEAVMDYENYLNPPEISPEEQEAAKILDGVPTEESQEDGEEEVEADGGVTPINESPRSQVEEKEREADVELNKTVHSFLQSGVVLPDDVYIHLIVRAINKLTKELEKNKPPPPVEEEDEEGDGEYFEGEEDMGFEEHADLEEITTASANANAGPSCPGYVIEDFPTTAAQALLLFQALSGYDYTKPRPQSVDRVSKYAPPAPTTRTDYDVSKCGLDAVYYIDTENPVDSMDVFLQERIAARIDVANEGSQIFLHEEIKSVITLVEPYSPLHPVHTCGIDISVCNQQAAALKKLLVYMNLYRPRGVLTPARMSEMAVGIVTELEETLAALVPKPAVGIEEVGDVGDVVEEGADEDISFVDQQVTKPSEVDEAAAPLAVAVAAADPATGDESGACTPVGPVFVPVDYIETSKLPVPLARALAECWTASEKASDASSCSFAMAMRELKYQMLQRRRGVHDTVCTILTKLDHKQTLLENFRDDFNSFSLDFRFDPECQAELHLRTLELRDAYWTLCEDRKDAAEKYVALLTGDASTAVMQLRTQCEGAAMVQSEMNRYLAAVQIIFDYTKAVGGYSSAEQQLDNELEDTVGGEDTSENKAAKPEGGKGGKDKKGKGAATSGPPVAFRIPVGNALLSESVADELPVAADPAAEVADATAAPAKGKGAKGGKAGAVEVHGAKETPLDVAIKAAIEASVLYDADTFSVNRELYSFDEGLCKVVENAIWVSFNALFCT